MSSGSPVRIENVIGLLDWLYRLQNSGGGGSGSVTSFAFTNANGVSGVVTNSTTTPNLTLTLGAITPASVAAVGTVTGSNLSGTNTGDQTSVSGNAGTATALQTARTINGVSFDGTANITIPVGTGSVTDVSVVTANGVSGSVANSTTTPAITLTLGAITPSSVASAGSVTGSNLSGTNTGDQTITLTGDVTGSGTGTFAATIANGAVTEAKMTLADNTTWNSSTSQHGFLKKLSNSATEYMDGTGNWSTPGGFAVVAGVAHVVSANATITAGYSEVIARYLEVSSGVTLEIGADSDLCII